MQNRARLISGAQWVGAICVDMHGIANHKEETTPEQTLCHRPLWWVLYAGTFLVLAVTGRDGGVMCVCVCVHTSTLFVHLRARTNIQPLSK